MIMNAPHSHSNQKIHYEIVICFSFGLIPLIIECYTLFNCAFKAISSKEIKRSFSTYPHAIDTPYWNVNCFHFNTVMLFLFDIWLAFWLDPRVSNCYPTTDIWADSTGTWVGMVWLKKLSWVAIFPIQCNISMTAF